MAPCVALANAAMDESASAVASAMPQLLQQLGSSSERQQMLGANTLASMATSEPAALAAIDCLPLLVKRLRSGRPAVQRAMAAALIELADASPAVQAAATEAIPALVALLGSSSPSVQEVAAKALFYLCYNNAANKEATAAVGGIQALIPLLNTSGVSSSSSSNNTITSSSSHSSSSSGGSNRSSSQVLTESAAGVLGFLANASPSLRRAVAAAGAIPPLRRLLHPSHGAYAQQQAAIALRNLSCRDIQAKRDILAADGAAALAAVVSGCSSREAQDAAAGALCNLSSSFPEGCAALAGAAGTIPALVQHLRRGGPEVGACTAALYHLARDCPSCQPAIVAAGGIPALVGVLQAAARGGSASSSGSGAAANDDDARIAAAALHTLALHTLPSAARAIQQAGGVNALEELMIGRRDRQMQQVVEDAHMFIAAAAVILHGEPAVAAAATQQQPEAAAQAAAGLPTAAAAECVPPARPPRVCAAEGCGATTGLRRCGGCGRVRYCSVACCKAHWRTHRSECRQWQAQAAATPAG